MVELFLLLIAAAYIIEMILLIVGLGNAGAIEPDHSYQPFVSVIVAARNEENYIADCVRSLLQLDYPREKLEIIVVNDSSTDRTGTILESFLPDPILKVYSTTPGSGNLHGKTNAVATGIRYSRGEIIMLTDADCVVQRGWVRRTVTSFGETTGVVGGFTTLTGDKVFERIQCLDWLYLFGIASATAGWGIPLTVIGNNFAVRREAYDKTGGYERIPFSVTEDFALVQAILRQTDYKVRFPTVSLVQSHPCRDLKHLYRQKKRWGVGGLSMISLGYLIMTIGWGLRLVLVLGIFLAPFWIVLAALIGMLLVDGAFLHKLLRRFSIKRMLPYFFPFEVYLTCYSLILPVLAIVSKKVVWKERSL